MFLEKSFDTLKTFGCEEQVFAIFVEKLSTEPAPEPVATVVSEDGSRSGNNHNEDEREMAPAGEEARRQQYRLARQRDARILMHHAKHDYPVSPPCNKLLYCG